MPPIDLLILLLLATAIAWATDRWRRSRVHSAYREMAVAHRMHYSPGDPLRLTPRVAARFPVPGAAAVRIIDLLYRTDEQNHHYVFTAEYTLGVVGPKNRIRRTAAFTESKLGEAAPQPIRLAPAELPLVEQYRRILGES
jgi:hypothetical protein